MSFHSKPWGHRVGRLGDEAERRCEEHLDELGRGLIRTGLNRPPLHVASLPNAIRHLPDFLTTHGWVEAKGVGRDRVLKIKVEDFIAWGFWAILHPVEIFVWDSHASRGTLHPLESVVGWVNDERTTLERFPEGKAYFAIPMDVVEGAS